MHHSLILASTNAMIRNFTEIDYEVFQGKHLGFRYLRLSPFTLSPPGQKNAGIENA
jgi:hypothetical protein